MIHVLKLVPLFASLNDDELDVIRSFKNVIKKSLTMVHIYVNSCEERENN